MRTPLVSIVVLLLHLAPALSVLADARQSFRQGVLAFERKNYDVAATSFRAAIAESGQESRRRDVSIYGDRLEEYLPWYWLGLSLARAGRCAEAQQAFDASERQAALKQVSRYFRTLQKERAGCPAPAPLVADATPGAAQPGGTQPPVTTSRAVEVAPPLTDRRADVPAAVPVTATAQPQGSTTTRLPSPVATATAPQRPPPVTEDPRLAPLRTRLRQQIAAARQLRGSAIEQVTPQWSRAQTALQQSLLSATAAESSTSVDMLTRLSADLEQRSRQVAALIPAAAPDLAGAAPPPQLRQAVAAFFRGRYSEAVGGLENARFSDPRAVAQLHLIRGAARYSLYLTSGEKDSSLRDLALADLAAFRRTDPRGEVPLPEVFSPRLRKILADSRLQ